MNQERLEKLIAGIESLRLLVIGDVMLDEYLWGDARRISPEAPVPVVQVERESLALGGAGNVAQNIIALGARASCCAVVGDDAPGRRIRQLCDEAGVDASALVEAPGRPTTHKTRVGARAQQVLRYDRETRAALDAETERRVLAAFAAALPEASGVIFQDYGKGLFSDALLDEAMRLCREAKVPASVDPKHQASPYRGAMLFKPNEAEAAMLSGCSVRGRAGLLAAAARLQEQLGETTTLVITRGAEGMTVFESGRPPLDVPIRRHEVFDVQGAGDTCIAALTLARLAGAEWDEAARFANAAAAVVVGKLGTAVAAPHEVAAQLGLLLPAPPKPRDASRG